MKNRILCGLCLLLGLSFGDVFGQSIYEAEKFMNKDLTGTARFVGMGGALGALGADISTMSVNPAGVGLFRKYDFSATLDYHSNEMDMNYLGSKSDHSKDKFNLGTLGFVISTHVGGDVLKYVNFGFNYKKVANFSNRFNVSGAGGGTIGHVMASQANNMKGDIFGSNLDGSDNAYRNHNYGWLGLAGYEGYLVDVDEVNGKVNGYYPHFIDNVGSRYQQRESGSIDQYDFNVAFNLSDQFFLGFTLGVYDVRYRNSMIYREDFRMSPSNDLEWAALATETSTEGSGVDFKLGAIIRPIESSPFRIGIAVHTPIFYKLTRYTNFYLDSDVYGGLNDKGEHMMLTTNVDSYNKVGGDDAFDYKLRTPWKLNLSLAHNIGTMVALGAEYEYQDYGSTRFKYDDSYGGSISYLRDQAKDYLKSVHVLRLGTEIKIIPEVAFRLGYNLETASFKKAAYMDIPAESTMTNTAYFNKDGVKNTFTIGAGYMGRIWYFDIAYKYDTRKMNFKAFDDDNLPFSKATANNNTMLFTLGFRL